MSQTATEPVTEEQTSLGDEEMHLTCCRDKDSALCGRDVTDDRIVGDEYDGPVCETCDRIALDLASRVGDKTWRKKNCPGCWVTLREGTPK